MSGGKLFLGSSQPELGYPFIYNRSKSTEKIKSFNDEM